MCMHLFFMLPVHTELNLLCYIVFLTGVMEPVLYVQSWLVALADSPTFPFGLGAWVPGNYFFDQVNLR